METRFEELQVSQITKDALKKLHIERMTDAQSRLLPRMLEGRDVLAIASPGGGKTLACVVTAVELLAKAERTQGQGTHKKS